jgi:ferredoxin-NADP reductase
VDAEMLAEVGPSPAELPGVYVCGPTPFVEAVAGALVQLGHEPHRVKTERFGPTGGERSGRSTSFAAPESSCAARTATTAS